MLGMKDCQCRQKWKLLLALALVILACNFPGIRATPLPVPPAFPSPTPSSPTIGASPLPSPFQPLPNTPAPTALGPAPTRAYQPVFEPAACAFSIPPGYSPECGYLIVPEDRAQPESRIIRLHVAIFPSRSPNPALDPVVHLAGGPGSSSVGLAGYMFGQGLDSVLEQRDLILVDQRGTGFSLPRLDCHEREELTPTLLESRLPPAESSQAIVEAFRRCADRLRGEGIDLFAYNSAASAADINDLRQALGYEKVNLYGVSYGTRLALTVIRDYPEAVRSVVLDSAYPLEVNLYTSLATNAERAFNVLFDRCASDPVCNAAYPGLRQVFYELVDQLNANPVTVPLAAGGAERRVLVDGGLLVDVLFVGLYNRPVAASMPKMIFDLRRGEYDILEDRLRLYFDTSSALGMLMAVQCSEEIPFNQPEDAFIAAEGVQPQIAAFFPASVQPLFAVCQEWGFIEPDPIENQPVDGDLPVLLLAGEYDPITPPDWGRQVAGVLSQAYFFEFPGNGHWVTRSSGCALEMALAFWEDPGSPPDAVCMQSLESLDFVH